MHKERDTKLATPRSRDSIRRDAFLLRVKLGLKRELYFDIVHFLENVLPIADPEFCLEVVDDTAVEVSGIQAEYIPRLNVIRVKQSVYDAAVRGHWWARSTLAHELGHYYYHDEQNVRYAKLAPFEKVPPDFDPERQANVFAAELLAPLHLIEGMSKRQVGDACGVPYAIAERQIRTLERVKYRQKRKRAAKKKRPSQKA